MTKPVEYLDREDLVDLARLLLGEPPPIRDIGLLESASGAQRMALRVVRTSTAQVATRNRTANVARMSQ